LNTSEMALPTTQKLLSVRDPLPTTKRANDQARLTALGFAPVYQS